MKSEAEAVAYGRSVKEMFAREKQPNIQTQIIRLLHDHGPMKIKDMSRTIHFRYKSIYTEALELEAMGLVDRDESGVWSLQPGVTPETLGIQHLVPSTTDVELSIGDAEPTPAPNDEDTAYLALLSGAPFDQKIDLIWHMISVGVRPVGVVRVLADIFFSGDINNLQWLKHVLTRDGAGYLTRPQQRLIFCWWATTRGLPYEDEDLPPVACY